MASYTKIDNFLGGVFTLKNRVRKNDGPHWVPNGVPNIRTMGEFSPMGAPMANDGGSNMPMEEVNGYHDVPYILLSYKTSGLVAFPHGDSKYTQI